jgi:hypothetical protein
MSSRPLPPQPVHPPATSNSAPSVMAEVYPSQKVQYGLPAPSFLGSPHGDGSPYGDRHRYPQPPTFPLMNRTRPPSLSIIQNASTHQIQTQSSAATQDRWQPGVPSSRERWQQAAPLERLLSAQPYTPPAVDSLFSPRYSGPLEPLRDYGKSPPSRVGAIFSKDSQYDNSTTINMHGIDKPLDYHLPIQHYCPLQLIPGYQVPHSNPFHHHLGRSLQSTRRHLAVILVR